MASTHTQSAVMLVLAMVGQDGSQDLPSAHNTQTPSGTVQTNALGLALCTYLRLS
jgi:hypothetical protein